MVFGDEKCFWADKGGISPTMRPVEGVLKESPNGDGDIFGWIRVVSCSMLRVRHHSW